MGFFFLFLLTTMSILAPAGAGAPSAAPQATPWKVRLTVPTRMDISQLALAPDGRTLITSDGAIVKQWDTTTGKELAAFQAPGTWSHFVGHDCDGKALVAREDAPHPPGIGLSQKPELAIVDLATGRIQRMLKLPETFTWLLRNPHGQGFATLTGDGRQVKLWDGAGKERAALRAPGTGQTVWCFSRDGKLLAAAGSVPSPVKSFAHRPNGEFTVWNVATGKELMNVFESGEVSSLAFSPSGTMLAAAGNRSGAVNVWEVATGKLRTALMAMKPAWRCVYLGIAFSPDGKTLGASWRARGSTDIPYGITVWDVTTGKELAVMKLEIDTIPILAFSGDGRTLATADCTGAVILWETGQPTTR